MFIYQVCYREHYLYLAHYIKRKISGVYNRQNHNLKKLQSKTAIHSYLLAACLLKKNTLHTIATQKKHICSTTQSQ